MNAEYSLEKLVKVLDRRLDDIGEKLKDIEKELRIANIALSERQRELKGDGQRETGVLETNRESV